jgi:hypothetical protein
LLFWKPAAPPIHARHSNQSHSFVAELKLISFIRSPARSTMESFAMRKARQMMPPRPDDAASAPAQDAAQTGNALMTMNGDKVIVIVDPYSTGCVVAQEALKRGYKLVVVWTKGVGENKTHGELCVSIYLFIYLWHKICSFAFSAKIFSASNHYCNCNCIATRIYLLTAFFYRINHLLTLHCCSPDIVC